MKLYIFYLNRTALHSAVENEEADVIQLLLEFEGIDINAKDEIAFRTYNVWFRNFWFLLFTFGKHRQKQRKMNRSNKYSMILII